MTERYALYFAPSTSSELAVFGTNVLGRHATKARQANASSTFAPVARWRKLTASPAHYGFHATLKAPFEIQDHTGLRELIAAVSSFAQQQTPIALKQLAPRRLSQFMALTLDVQPNTLTTLAQSIVETFEPFRKPLSDADRARRQAQPLTANQLDLLERYGYPYVADEFRFHMTLSGALAQSDEDFVAWLSAQYSATVTTEPELDRIAVYGQKDRQSPFVQLAVCPFSSTQTGE